MVKTTIYLPEDLDLKLEARAETTGTSKAELVRRAVARLLDEESGSDEFLEFPVFHSGRSMTVDEMDQLMVDQMAERAARR